MPNPAQPFDPALRAAFRGLLDPSVLTPGQQAILDAVPVATRDRFGVAKCANLPRPAMGDLVASHNPPPLRIQLLEPDAPPPAGDRLPCHLFMPEVEWRNPAELLRPDSPPPPLSLAMADESFRLTPAGERWLAVLLLVAAVWFVVLLVLGARLP